MKNQEKKSGAQLIKNLLNSKKEKEENRSFIVL